MGLAVFVQIALGLEGEATGGTRIGSFPCVGADVFLKDAWLGTWTATVSAHVLPWLLVFSLSSSGWAAPFRALLAGLGWDPLRVLASGGGGGGGEGQGGGGWWRKEAAS